MLYKVPMEHEKTVYQNESVFPSSQSKQKNSLFHAQIFAPVSKNIRGKFVLNPVSEDYSGFITCSNKFFVYFVK